MTLKNWNVSSPELASLVPALWAPLGDVLDFQGQQCVPDECSAQDQAQESHLTQEEYFQGQIPHPELRATLSVLNLLNIEL